MSRRSALLGERRRGLEQTTGRRGRMVAVVGEGEEDHGHTWESGIGICIQGIGISCCCWLVVCVSADAHGLQMWWECSYRPRGSWFLRAAARARGSNDFAMPSGTGVDRDDDDSSSVRWSERRLAGASSETLRRDKKP